MVAVGVVVGDDVHSLLFPAHLLLSPWRQIS